MAIKGTWTMELAWRGVELEGLEESDMERGSHPDRHGGYIIMRNKLEKYDLSVG